MAVRFGTDGDDVIDAYDGDDVLAGFAGDDLIYTGAGDDVVFGGIDDDTIVAGTGLNLIFGGADYDVFVFTPESSGMTIIGDFEDGIDKLDLSQLGITGMADLDIAMNSKGAIITIGTLIINMRIDGPGGFGAEDFIFAIPDDLVVLDFEDVSHADGYASLFTADYAGFTWTNFGVLEYDEYTLEKTSGYRVGDGNNLLYNGYGEMASMERAENFDLDSISLSAAWSDGLILTVVGYDEGILKGKQGFVLSYGASTVFELDDDIFDSVDYVEFFAEGGVDVATDTGSGNHFGMDSMVVIG
ncbi:MAG: hypothetical protein CML68_17095 [Rhodobacteraceae bacterium]|nr:hypothetical protein [Paracoccaceae bacterium]